MADVKNIVTLGIGASPGKVTWFITTGLEPDAEIALDSAYAIDVHAALQDLTVVVPAIAQEYTEVFYLDTLVDEAGDTLVDGDGNILMAERVELEMAYVVHAALQDLTVVVPEET